MRTKGQLVPNIDSGRGKNDWPNLDLRLSLHFTAHDLTCSVVFLVIIDFPL